MTSAMPVQCSNQLSYEVTQWRAGEFVGLMFSRRFSCFFYIKGFYIKEGKSFPSDSITGTIIFMVLGY